MEFSQKKDIFLASFLLSPLNMEQMAYSAAWLNLLLPLTLLYFWAFQWDKGDHSDGVAPRRNLKSSG